MATRKFILIACCLAALGALLSATGTVSLLLGIPDPAPPVLPYFTVALDQDSFRFRNDDGTEATATWMANANTNPSNFDPDVDTDFRLRILMQATGAEVISSPQLRYSLNGGAYTNVDGSSSVVRSLASANLTDGGATTQQLGAGSFKAGTVDEVDGLCAGNTYFNQETEFEWSVRVRGADVVAGDTIDFRLYDGTTLLDTYTNTGRVTLGAGGGGGGEDEHPRHPRLPPRRRQAREAGRAAAAAGSQQNLSLPPQNEGTPDRTRSGTPEHRTSRRRIPVSMPIRPVEPPTDVFEPIWAEKWIPVLPPIRRPRPRREVVQLAFTPQIEAETVTADRGAPSVTVLPRRTHPRPPSEYVRVEIDTPVSAPTLGWDSISVISRTREARVRRIAVLLAHGVIEPQVATALTILAHLKVEATYRIDDLFVEQTYLGQIASNLEGD